MGGCDELRGNDIGGSSWVVHTIMGGGDEGMWRKGKALEALESRT